MAVDWLVDCLIDLAVWICHLFLSYCNLTLTSGSETESSGCRVRTSARPSPTLPASKHNHHVYFSLSIYLSIYLFLSSSLDLSIYLFINYYIYKLVYIHLFLYTWSLYTFQTASPFSSFVVYTRHCCLSLTFSSRYL